MTRLASCVPLCLLLTACRPPSDPSDQPASAKSPTHDAEPSADQPAVQAHTQDQPPTATDAAHLARLNARYDDERDPETWAKRFEREGREVYDQQELILERLDLREGMRVADVGAGTGLFTLPLARQVGAKGHVFAVDVQPYMLEHIAERAKRAGLRNIETIKASQTASGLPADSVDLVFMCDAYHHIEAIGPYLASLHDALVPGGRLVVIDFDRSAAPAGSWIRDHIRADPSVFQAEIEAAGFDFLGSKAGLTQNVFLTFERPRSP